jgi:hypothetical protein
MHLLIRDAWCSMDAPKKNTQHVSRTKYLVVSAMQLASC